jgi:hypothetical protein
MTILGETLGKASLRKERAKQSDIIEKEKDRKIRDKNKKYKVLLFC